MKTPDELYEEREKRLRDAIELKEPDRVPVMMGGGGSKEGRLPASLSFYNIAAFKAATIKSILEFEPDVYWAALFDNPGIALEALDPKRTKWPGYSLPDDIPTQHIETESLLEDEYDLFLSDPSDFILRYHLPRVYGSLGPLAKLPPIRTWAMGLPTAALVSPEFLKVAEVVSIAGKAMLKSREVTRGFDDEMAAHGFPPFSHGGSMAPFDQVANTFRGLNGISRDIHRRPEKLLQACDLFANWNIQGIKAMAGIKRRGNPRRGILPLTRGSDNFLSPAQFKTFYWPFLKEVILGLIHEGCIPLLFAEGGYNSRLQYIKELPKGHCIWMFDRTDMAKAKEVIGETTCIAGNIPVSKILSGTPDQIRQICKELIDIAGKNGGYIMTCGCSMDEAKPDTLHAMIDFTKEYGVYPQR